MDISTFGTSNFIASDLAGAAKGGTLEAGGNVIIEGAAGVGADEVGATGAGATGAGAVEAGPVGAGVDAGGTAAGGTVAAGGTRTPPVGAAGTLAGGVTWSMMLRGATVRELDNQAKPSVVVKNKPAAMAVDRLKKLAEPVAPNKLPDAPLPNAAPMSAPLPCCTSTKPITAIADRTWMVNTIE